MNHIGFLESIPPTCLNFVPGMFGGAKEHVAFALRAQGRRNGAELSLPTQIDWVLDGLLLSISSRFLPRFFRRAISYC